MVFFGYNASAPSPLPSLRDRSALGPASTALDRFEAPYASMVHDFIVNENTCCFRSSRSPASMARAMKGQPLMAWEPKKGSRCGEGAQRLTFRHRLGSAARIATLPRHETPGRDGSSIVADVMQVRKAPMFKHPTARRPTRRSPRARICRWTFDLGRQYRPLHDKTDLGRPERRYSASRSRARSEDIHGGTPAPTRICRVRRRSPASACPEGRGRAARKLSAARRRTPFPRRGSSLAMTTPPEGDGWMHSPWYGERGRKQRPRRC